MFFLVCLTNVLGREIIIFIFDEKWLPALLPFQLLMFLSAFRNTTVFWNPLLQSRGITRYLLFAAPVNLVGIVGLGLWWTKQYGILGMSLAVSVTMILSISLFVPVFTKKVLRRFCLPERAVQTVFNALYGYPDRELCEGRVFPYESYGVYPVHCLSVFSVLDAFLFAGKKKQTGDVPHGKIFHKQSPIAEKRPYARK